MITEILGLAGSGILGSIFGMLSDAWTSKQEREILKLKLEMAKEARLNQQSIDYLSSSTGFVTSPAYSIAFVYLAVVYGLCTFICIFWPNIQLLTFNPDQGKHSFEFLWGLFSISIDSSKVYTITTGGVGYGLLHPLSFQIGTVLTGATARTTKN